MQDEGELCVCSGLIRDHIISQKEKTNLSQYRDQQELQQFMLDHNF